MPATDILTVNEARAAVNLTGTGQDTQLELFISGISGRIDDLCGPVVVRAVTDEQHDGGKARIYLDESPVASVTSVVEWVHTTSNSLTGETNASKPAAGFLLDTAGRRAFLWRRTSGSTSVFPAGKRNVVVTYQAGRFANTASVDAKFKLAALSVLRRMWKRETAAWAQSPDFFPSVDDPASADRFRGFFRAVDPMVKELLADELRPPEVG